MFFFSILYSHWRNVFISFFLFPHEISFFLFIREMFSSFYLPTEKKISSPFSLG